MAIRIRVYPQHNSIGARRNRAVKRQNRQLKLQRQQLRLQQQMIRQQQLMQQQALGLQHGYSQVQGFGTGLNNPYYGGYSSFPTSLPPSYGFGNAWSGTAYLAPGVLGFTTGFGSSPFSVAQNAAFGLGSFF